MDKTKAIYGLDKTPDSVVIQYQNEELKKLHIQIGALKSYILELEYMKLKYEANFKPIFQETEIYKNMVTQIRSLNEQNKKLSIKNDRLLYELIQEKTRKLI